MDNFWWPSIVEAQDGNLRVRDSALKESESMDENPSQCPVCDGPMKDWQSVPPWQPIETVPRDGTEFLAYDSRTKKQAVCKATVVAMKEGEWVRTYPTQMDGEYGPMEDEFGYNNEDVTHWMPLPEPPASNGATA